MMMLSKLLFRLESAVVLIPDLMLLMTVVGVWCALGWRWRRGRRQDHVTRPRWTRRRLAAMIRSRPWETVGGIVVLLTLAATCMVVMAPRYWTIAIAPLVILFGRALVSTGWPKPVILGLLVVLVGFNIANRHGALYADMENGIATQTESAYKFRERSHEFIPYLNSDVEAMRLLDEQSKGIPVITASPYALFLSFPELGYVTRPGAGAVVGIDGGLPPHFVDVEEWLRAPKSDDPIFVRGRFLSRAAPYPPFEEKDHSILDDHLPDRLMIFQKRFEQWPTAPRDQWYSQSGWMGETLAEKADLRARTLTWTGRAARALAELGDGVNLEPGSADLHFVYGQWLLLTGQLEAAVVQLQQCLAIDPHRQGASYALGMALRGTGQFQEAAAAFQSALRADATDARSASELGRLLLAAGKPNEALEHLQLAVKLGHQDRDTCQALGQTFAKLNRFQDAVPWFEIAARIEPNSVDAVGAHAVALVQSGDLARAIPVVRRAIEIQPDNADLHVYLATLLTRVGMRPEAVEALREALALAPNHPLAKNNLAWELAVSPDETLRRGEESLTLARQLAEESQRQEPAYLDTLAAALARTGRFEEAVSVADEAIARSRERQQPKAVEALAARKRMYLRRIPYTDPFIKTEPLDGKQ